MKTLLTRCGVLLVIFVRVLRDICFVLDCSVHLSTFYSASNLIQTYCLFIVCIPSLPNYCLRTYI